MIPLSLVVGVVALATEALRAFNGLSQSNRDAIVEDILKDKAKRDAVWDRFTSWVAAQFAKVASE